MCIGRTPVSRVAHTDVNLVPLSDKQDERVPSTRGSEIDEVRDSSVTEDLL